MGLPRASIPPSCPATSTFRLQTNLGTACAALAALDPVREICGVIVFVSELPVWTHVVDVIRKYDVIIKNTYAEEAQTTKNKNTFFTSS